ncbi:hypothetical protein TrVE_jg3005 [Triparma verrucosa]|uniref:Glycosyl hydrolase family 13 catalytic domain-containing protein n=1 Tax=Triparma verrucosa TaxID=1606542 RepID=A0A9W7FJU9_9STRA|nr:hypothetical protein TrVE_jg3005 [Triparma verrucosa]
MTKLLALLTLLGLASASTVDTDNWVGRNIYFILLDRFAGGTPGCQNGKEWCNGNIRGVTKQIPYIKKMGFDAVWITPVVKQVEWRDNWNGTGYHGYWAKDFNKIDEHFGTPEDLKQLSQTLKENGMLFMLDIVANHVGPLHSLDDVASLGDGLNDLSGEQFHQLAHFDEVDFEEYLKNPYTMMEAGDACWPYYDFGHGCNETVILDGWFGDLGDLNHEDEPTAQYLLKWIGDMQKNYDIDGFRLDTALYIPKPFLEKFQEEAGVYITGEVVTYNQTLHSSFQDGSALTGLLNFPITEFVKPTFSVGGGVNFVDFASLLENQKSLYSSVHLLTNFVDNHDGDRFLTNHTLAQLENALTWSWLWHGIPSFYYGTEVPTVAEATDCRTSQWNDETGEFLDGSEGKIGELMTNLNEIRREFGLAFGGVNAFSLGAVLKAGEEGWMAFERSGLLAVVSNGDPKTACFKSPCCPTGEDLLKVGARGEEEPNVACDGEEVCVELVDGAPLVFNIESCKETKM